MKQSGIITFFNLFHNAEDIVKIGHGSVLDTLVNISNNKHEKLYVQCFLSGLTT